MLSTLNVYGTMSKPSQQAQVDVHDVRRDKNGISATTMAMHHHLQCDLFLYYSYHGNQKSSREDNDLKTLAPKLLKATFNRGEQWERRLLDWLDRKGLLLRVTGSILEVQDIQEIIELEDRERFFISGLAFRPPNAIFESRFRENGNTPVHFSTAKPDLVEVRKEKSGIIRWQVIDAKSSSNVKTSHHVQIYFYHICLEQCFPEVRYVALGTAGIWLPSSLYAQEEPTFETLKYIPTNLLALPLNDFLFKKLPSVLSQERSKVQWHFNPLCQGCNFRSVCAREAVQNGKLGAMANISHHDFEVLQSLLSVSGPDRRTEVLNDIEDLHSLFSSGKQLNTIAKHHPTTLKAAKRVLKLQHTSSPVVEAARTGIVQPLNKRIHTLPSYEDIAVILSLVLDPYSGAIVAYHISTYSNLSTAASPGPLSGRADDFLSALSSLVEYILDLDEVNTVPLRTQFYVFTAGERNALERILIDSSLICSCEDEELGNYHVKICIGALCEGASLLATSLQPLVLSGALLGFLGKKNGLTTEELRTCLSRLGLTSHKLTNEEMRLKIVQELDRLRKQGRSNVTNPDIGHLPRVVVLKQEIERLLALPVPGYWDLPTCHALLTTGVATEMICPSDEAIYGEFVANDAEKLDALLQARNQCIFEVLDHARKVVGPATLVNEARVLTSEFMDICGEENLRKLFFMQQFEVLSRLNTLWRDRIDGCPDAPRLQYIYTNRLPDNSYIHRFKLVSGYVDIPSDKERTIFGYLLTEDDDADADLPVEALFDDLAVFNILFPLNKFTKNKWTLQPERVRKELFVADVHDILIRDFQTFVVLRTYGSAELRLKKRTTYRLSPRLVDFNITKVLSTLVDIDFQVPSYPGYMTLPSFVQLFSDPVAFAKLASDSFSVVQQSIEYEKAIHKRTYELSELAPDAKILLLQPSQRQAFKRILKYRLSVIWGPPGTGKTHTIALSLLRLIEIRSMRQEGELLIFLTAVTHAAIQACIKKLNTLMETYRLFPGMKLDWLNSIKLERVQSGALHPVPKDKNATYIYAGTVYQLYNFCNRINCAVDCVVIDEAGQLGLGPASLVLKSLRNTGRIIIAGDNEQLAPILSTVYPQVGPRLFGSILDALMPPTTQHEGRNQVHTALTETTDHSMIVQLTENFRLNADLGAFVSLIYKRSFTAKTHKTLQITNALEAQTDVENIDSVHKQAKTLLVALFRAFKRKKQDVFQAPSLRSPTDYSETLGAHPSASLALVRLQVTARHLNQAGYEQHVRGGAYFAAVLARLVLSATPSTTTVFVATPHRIQRQAVRDALHTRVDELAEAFGTMQLGADTSRSAEKGKQQQQAATEDHDNNGGDNNANTDTNANEDNSGLLTNITVDTVERLQGSEADIVICLFAHTYPGNAHTAIDFLLERRRLNVAISRAKALCILIASQEVLRPPVRIFANPGSARGFAFLRAYEERAWTTSVTVDLDELDMK